MSQPGNDNLIIDYLIKKGFEVNKESYLSLAYPLTNPADYDDQMLDEWREAKAEMNREE